MVKSNIDRQLAQTLFLQRENDFSHLSYDDELSFYDAVKRGDFNLVKKIMLPLSNNRLGRLSDNQLRNMQYHLIITIAFITRFCIEGGVDPELAYTLSDLNIQRIDKCQSCEEVLSLHEEMVLDIANRMHLFHQKRAGSQKIIACKNYINHHLHECFSIKDLARTARLSANYLCALFKKETGMTIAHYLRHQRIEAAKNLLQYSDTAYSDIGHYLAFSSHSHFISIFKKEVGITPKEYRSKYYRHNWTKHEQ